MNRLYQQRAAEAKHSITVLTEDDSVPYSKFERTGGIHSGPAKTVAIMQGVRIKQQTR